MAGNHSDLEKRLWDAADELRANSKLKSSEYSVPVLGLIFLRFADNKFAGVEKELAEQTGERRRRTISKTDYLARGSICRSPLDSSGCWSCRKGPTSARKSTTR